MHEKLSLRGYPAKGRRAWIVLGAAVCGACSPGPPPDVRSLQLDLVEEWHYALPPGFEVGGVAVGPRTTVVWSKATPEIVVRDSAGRWRHTLISGGSRLTGASMPAAEGPVVLLDASGRIVSDASKWAGARAFETMPTNPEDAELFAGRWLVSVSDTMTGMAVLAPGRDSNHIFFRYRTPIGPGRPVRDRGTLDVYGDELLVSSRFFPFTVFVLDSAGTVRSKFSPTLALPMRPDSARDLRARLVSMSTVRLDRGYLQTLSDPFSLGRVLVVYDDSGNTVRATKIDVPMSVVASYPADRRLFAVRALETQEVVAYR